MLPGGIDSHVHISQPSGPGIVMADDFESATRSAAFGGNTLVMPFCLQQKGEGLRAALMSYHQLAAGRCHIDVSFHLIISDPTASVLGQELPALVADGYTSFKVFMTYEGLALADKELLEVFACARKTGALVMVHAENYDAIRYLTEQLERDGSTAPRFHATSRPIAVEREATHRGDQPGGARRCPHHDRPRVQRRGHGTDPLGTRPWPEDLRRDLSTISRADREGSRRPQHGRGKVCLQSAASRCR